MKSFLNNCFNFNSSTSLMNLLQDEYSSKCRMSTLTSPCHFEDYSSNSNSTRFLNSLLTLQGHIDSSHLIIPLSLSTDTFNLPNQFRQFGQLNYKSELKYHTSSILAAAYDTMTLPFRSSDGLIRMFDISGGLSNYGRKVASLGMNFPLSMQKNEYLVDHLNQSSLDFVSLTPNCIDFNNSVSMQAVSVRGLTSPIRPTDFKSDKQYVEHPYYHCDSAKSVCQRYFDLNYPRTMTGLSFSSSRLPVSKPYPHIFKPEIDTNGYIDSENPRSKNQTVDKVSNVTILQSSAETGKFVESFSSRGQKINLNRFHRFKETGLETDEFNEVMESLKNLCDCYDNKDIL